ncbi:uncharacterized protein EAF01_002352 [Botrytis porri]|uniref:uncharacterized protein n=1 Tax=Botrytis porri TaxID=87229 RepID=UPI0018FF92A7|nr:uncharacterized protein EAF01_002352 [Botrytis porri]KAF7910843.1 hypothetical protein EAF01_002352 [Botrytis porri]
MNYQKLIDNTEVDGIQDLSIKDNDPEDELLKVEARIVRCVIEIAVVLRGTKESGSYRFMNQKATKQQRILIQTRNIQKSLNRKSTSSCNEVTSSHLIPIQTLVNSLAYNTTVIQLQLSH